MIYILIWFLVVMVILRFTPEQKIKAMADFFNKVLPKFPISDIVKFWKKD